MTEEKFEILVAIEGETAPRAVSSRREATVSEVLGQVIREVGRDDLHEVFIEDGDDPLPPESLIREILRDLRLLHVATTGKVKVTVEYGQASVTKKFRPAVTMEKIIRWAIKPDELNVQAPVEDLQLKLGNQVLPADMHLGQVTRGRKEISFSLVFKVKPQG